MSNFEDRTLTFKKQIEQANKSAINNHGKYIEDRPMTIEEMMKQRDSETFNVDYIAEPVNPIIRTNLENVVNKSEEERLDELTNMNIDQSTVKTQTYVCSMFDQNIDINVSGILECYPPIYQLGPGFTLPFLKNEISLPSDFVFERTHITQFKSNLSFVMKYGDNVFVNDYGNNGHMLIGLTEEFKYIEGGRCIQFYETSTSCNRLTFEYNKNKNVMKFLYGNYHLNYDQCKVFEGISKEQMTGKI